MAGRRKKKAEEEAGEAWLLPYSDLMTLLLAVFIVLFAVSKMDQAKSEEMSKAFSDSLMSKGGGIFSQEGTSILPLNPDGSIQEMPGSEDAAGEESSGEQNSGEKIDGEQNSGEKIDGEQNSGEEIDGDQSSGQNDIDANNAPPGSNLTEEQLKEILGKYDFENMEELKAELDNMLKEEKLDSSISATLDSRGLVITLKNTILFDPGSAELKPQNIEPLTKIAEKINTLDNYIRVEGHTDSRPINTMKYPSNWELSSARATSVVRLFVEKCGVPPEKVLPVGYGENKPIADNSTAKGRAKNRRIDIIVLSERYNNLESQIKQEP